MPNENKTIRDMVSNEFSADDLADEIGEVLVTYGFYLEINSEQDQYTFYEGDPRRGDLNGNYAFVFNKKRRYVDVHDVRIDARPSQSNRRFHVKERPTDLIDLIDIFYRFVESQPSLAFGQANAAIIFL